MADNAQVTLHNVNVGKLLKSPMFADLVNRAADQVLAAIEDDDGEAFVEEYSTDRGAAAVLVPAEMQARDGALTRAAAAVGLIVVQAEE